MLNQFILKTILSGAQLTTVFVKGFSPRHVDNQLLIRRHSIIDVYQTLNSNFNNYFYNNFKTLY